MPSFARILVPLTIDPETERALPFARRLAQLCGVEVVLYTWSFDDGEAAIAQHHLEELAGDLGVPVVTEARCSEEAGPAHPIWRAARAHDALVVMASHARSRLGEPILGSVAEDLLRASRRPVVLVGPDAEQAHTGAVGPIVVCVDGSDVAESALLPATSLAERLAAPLELVEVVDPLLIPAVDAYGNDVVESSYLASVVTSLPGALRPAFEVLHGRPSAAIVSYAGTGAELLAVATHGWTGLHRAVLGSVAMEVVRHARCPVLVTPAPR